MGSPWTLRSGAPPTRVRPAVLRTSARKAGATAERCPGRQIGKVPSQADRRRQHGVGHGDPRQSKQIIGALSELAQQMRPPWKAAFTGADPRVDGQGDSVRKGRRARQATERALPLVPSVRGGTRGRGHGAKHDADVRAIVPSKCVVRVHTSGKHGCRVPDDGRRACTQVPRVGAGPRAAAQGVRNGCPRPVWRVRTLSVSTSPLEVPF
ncbi:uncharacterized protein LOC101704251 [Heterocephalus glaber]|uniref:Uncharacterized protein LOC101704251 n=1 Tax=Heterocephalus glaber TaxID=10181 RepID=A0AAX6QIV2_HETGA|nr:uncharacterized protein LOC101704251 [Heterocephalus glaber]